MAGPVTITPDAAPVTITPDASQGSQPGFLDKEIPLDSYKDATLSGVQSIGRGVRGAVQGMWQTVQHPIDAAKSIAALPSQAAQVPGAVRDINSSPDPVGTYAKVAQETAGQGAGQALTALATEGIVKGAPAAASAAKPIVRGALRTASDVVDPDITGLASPRLAHAQRLAGRIADKMADKPAPETPPIYPGASEPATPPQSLLQAQPLAQGGGKPAVDPAAGLGQIPVRGSISQQMQQGPTRPSLKQMMDQLNGPLNDALGGKALDPNVPLKNQVPARGGIAQQMNPAPDLPDGHTAVDSSALRSYKYDPSAQEFHAQYKGGDTVHVYGDVSPDEAQAFDAAPSKGKAMPAIKNGHPLVAKIVDGKRLPVKATASQ